MRAHVQEFSQADLDAAYRRHYSPDENIYGFFHNAFGWEVLRDALHAAEPHLGARTIRRAHIVYGPGTKRGDTVRCPVVVRSSSEVRVYRVLSNAPRERLGYCDLLFAPESAEEQQPLTSLALTSLVNVFAAMDFHGGEHTHAGLSTNGNLEHGFATASATIKFCPGIPELSDWMEHRAELIHNYGVQTTPNSGRRMLKLDLVVSKGKTPFAFGNLVFLEFASAN